MVFKFFIHHIFTTVQSGKMQFTQKNVLKRKKCKPAF